MIVLLRRSSFGRSAGEHNQVGRRGEEGFGGGGVRLGGASQPSMRRSAAHNQHDLAKYEFCISGTYIGYRRMMGKDWGRTILPSH
eukprot:scaffold69_cov198-Alexandrium_tamarense.AAC.14